MKTALLTVLVFFGSFIQSQNLKWAKTAGSVGSDRPQGIAVDANKNVIITGMYGGTVDFDPGPATSTLSSSGSTWDVYVLKLDSMGNFLWVRGIGGSANSDIGAAVKTDASGNVFVTGSFDGTVDFDPGSGVSNLVSLGGYNDAFVLKLNASGNFVWVKQFGGPDSDVGTDVTVDGAGNVIAVGGFQSTVDFDPGTGSYPLTAPGTSSVSAGNQQGYIVKMDNAGNFIWAGGILGGGFSLARSVITDATNDIYFCGNFNGTKDFNIGPGTYTMTSSSGQSSSYIMKVTAAGNFVWAKGSGQGPNSQANDIALDGAGNLYATGNYGLGFDFGPGTTTLTTAGGSDIYVLKLDITGNFIWAKSVGSASGYEDGTGIAADAAGNTYISGFFGGTGDFDPNAGISNLTYLAGPSGTDAFLLKLNSAGSLVFAEAMGGTTGNTCAWDITVDAQHNIYTCGGFFATVDFDKSAATVTGTSNGGEDIYIQKFAQNVCTGMALSVVSTTNISCASSNGYATAAVTGGNGTVSYTWSNGTFMPTATFSSASIYTVMAVDGLGCTRTSAVLINGFTLLNSFDVTANLVVSNFVPGLTSTMHINATNNGCIATSGKIKLVLDPSRQTFNGSNPPPSLVSGDTLIWNYPAMSYGTSFFVPYISVKTSTAATIGDTICMPLIITPITGDVDVSNNQKQYCIPVVSSYDPNDKKVYPKGACDNGQILNSQLLTYTLRFQNTGTANAINIMVKDSLPATLDLSTVRVTGYSHPLVTEVAGRVLKFHFNNINLADAATNEPMSHGYVVFEVKPAPGLPNNTPVKNSVGIYFDYNAPVLTNTVSNTVVSAITCGTLTGIGSVGNDAAFVVYPNPAREKITVRLSEEAPSIISLVDVMGKELLSLTGQSAQTELDLGHLAQGVYVLRISQNGASFMQKLVISR